MHPDVMKKMEREMNAWDALEVEGKLPQYHPRIDKSTEHEIVTTVMYNDVLWRCVDCMFDLVVHHSPLYKLRCSLCSKYIEHKNSKGILELTEEDDCPQGKDGKHDWKSGHDHVKVECPKCLNTNDGKDISERRLWEITPNWYQWRCVQCSHKWESQYGHLCPSCGALGRPKKSMVYAGGGRDFCHEKHTTTRR